VKLFYYLIGIIEILESNYIFVFMVIVFCYLLKVTIKLFNVTCKLPLLAHNVLENAINEYSLHMTCSCQVVIDRELFYSGFFHSEKFLVIT